MNWDWIEPSKDVWWFDFFDGLVSRINSYHITILASLWGTPRWSNPNIGEPTWRWPPTDLDGYAEYVGKVVERYDGDGYLDAPGSPRVRYVGIWNEPNIEGFWMPSPNSHDYTRMLRKAYVAAKYADPTAVVIFGGMAGNGIEGWEGWELDFIQHVYDDGGGRYFDVMGIHPYTHPDEGLDKLISRIAATRSVLDSNGDTDVTIWMDEIGWPISPSATTWGRRTLTDQEVADWLVLVYSQPVLSRVGKVFWYSFRDTSTDPDGLKYGLTEEDNTPKPQYFKYKEVTGGPR